MTSEARAYLIALIVCLAASALPLSQLYESATKKFYWTHADMKLPLEAGKEHFEIYVGNQLLQSCLDRGLLAIREENRVAPLTKDDFSIRLNRRCEFSTVPLVLASASVTASLMFLVLFVLSILRRKRDLA